MINLRKIFFLPATASTVIIIHASPTDRGHTHPYSARWIAVRVPPARRAGERDSVANNASHAPISASKLHDLIYGLELGGFNNHCQEIFPCCLNLENLPIRVKPLLGNVFHFRERKRSWRLRFYKNSALARCNIECLGLHLLNWRKKFFYWVFFA